MKIDRESSSRPTNPVPKVLGQPVNGSGERSPQDLLRHGTHPTLTIDTTHTEKPGTMITSSESVETASIDAEHMQMYVQLRPRWAAQAKCKAALAELCRQHDTVNVTVAGVAQDSRTMRITLAIDLGSRLGIARFSDEAVAAYQFTQTLFTQMFEYLPQYVVEPTEAEQDAALDLAVAGLSNASALRTVTYAA